MNNEPIDEAKSEQEHFDQSLEKLDKLYETIEQLDEIDKDVKKNQKIVKGLVGAAATVGTAGAIVLLGGMIKNSDAMIIAGPAMIASAMMSVPVTLHFSDKLKSLKMKRHYLTFDCFSEAGKACEEPEDDFEIDDEGWERDL